MYGRNITTGRGRSGGAGSGFRGSSPPYPYVGRGRGGLPRCQYPGATFSYGGTSLPASPARMTREQELDLLKKQSVEIGKELESIEARIRELETDKTK